MRVADVVVEFIAKYCSPKVFLLTGNGAMYLNDAMQIHPDIEYVCVRNEAVAPLAASAYSKLTGKTGTVCVTAGPGAANAMPGVVEAWVEGASILVLSGQVPSQEKHNFGNEFVKNQRSFGIAGIPIIDYVRDFTKLALSIDSVDKLEISLRQVYTSLKSGRPGPIWLDIPLDVQSSPCEPINFSMTFQELGTSIDSKKKSDVNSENSTVLENLVSEARKPLFVIGSGSESAYRSGLLPKWIESNQVVFALTRPNAYFFPISYPGNLGVIGVRGRNWSREILRETDLVVALGSRLPSSVVGSNYSFLSPDARIVLINSESGEFLRHQNRIANSLPMTVEDFLQNDAFVQSIAINLYYRSWIKEVEALKSVDFAKERPSVESPLDLYWFCQNLESKMNSSHTLTTDAGSNYYACGQVLSFQQGFKEVTSGTFAAMGVSIPLAIGSAVAQENLNRIICITGDGSIELNVQELQTISNYSLNIAIFVINNGGYASMRAWQDSFFDSRYIGSTDETGTRPMNFAKIANAFNLQYDSISSISEFFEKIDYIVNSKRPILVEVICDPNQILDLPMNVDTV